MFFYIYCPMNLFTAKSHTRRLKRQSPERFAKDLSLISRCCRLSSKMLLGADYLVAEGFEFKGVAR